MAGLNEGVGARKLRFKKWALASGGWRSGSPPENVKKELDQAYRELARKVSIRGFRKGKIPRPVLERYHRSSVEDEVMQKLIPSSFQQAVKEQGLRAVGRPKLDDINLDEEKVLRYTATVEVLPDIALETAGRWELTKEVRVVAEADVERELHDLQNRHISLVSITEDRPVQGGTMCSSASKAFAMGNRSRAAKTENYALVVGSKSVDRERRAGSHRHAYGGSPGDCGAVSRNLCGCGRWRLRKSPFVL